MEENSRKGIGSELEQLKNRFDEWRQHRKRGARVPKELWQSAIRLSKDYSVSELSRTLRLDYPKLKKRVEALRGDSARQKELPSAFVEVGATSSLAEAECVVEFEDSKGTTSDSSDENLGRGGGGRFQVWHRPLGACVSRSP
jgi:hypothetical protein